MHELVRAVSRALSAQNVEELERLVSEAHRAAALPLKGNLGELSLASGVLERQVRAAELHLGLALRVRGGTERRNPWAL